MFRLIKRAPWIAMGALGAWFLDPINGGERRVVARRKLDELFGTPETTVATEYPEIRDTEPLQQRTA